MWQQMVLESSSEQLVQRSRLQRCRVDHTNFRVSFICLGLGNMVRHLLFVLLNTYMHHSTQDRVYVVPVHDLQAIQHHLPKAWPSWDQKQWELHSIAIIFLKAILFKRKNNTTEQQLCHSQWTLFLIIFAISFNHNKFWLFSWILQN